MSVNLVKKAVFSVLTLFCLILPMLLLSCKTNSIDPLDPPDFTPTKPPSDWTTMDAAPGAHVRVIPVSVNKIPAQQIALPRQQSSGMIRPLSDGGCLSVSQIQTDPKDTGGNPSYDLRVIRFKADGSVAWDKQYKDDPFKGYHQTMCVFADDSFAVSLHLQSDPSTGSPSIVSVLYRFSSNGSLMWKTKENTRVPESLDYLFALDNGEMIAAGMTPVTKADGSFDSNDIGILRIGKDGTLSAPAILGTSGNDNLTDAAYSATSGLVLFWRSDAPANGTASGGSIAQESHLTCFGEDLRERWSVILPLDESIYSIESLSADGSILGTGAVKRKEKDAALNVSVPALFCYDSKGQRRWVYPVNEDGSWILAAAGLSGGKFVTGIYQRTDKQGEESVLSVLNQAGSLEKSLEPIPGIVQQLVPTRDGGFTAVLRQTVGSLPQPPYISSIWTDSEAIVAHYNSRLDLVWRRSIDQYKHDLRTDIVIPTSDDKLLVG